MSDSLTGKSRANLREAFIALEKSEVKSSHVSIGPCLSLIRLRDLAQKASLTTTTDSHHIWKCRKCSVRFEAMKAELGTEPRILLETALGKIKLTLVRFAIGERLARDLFHRLHAHRGEPDGIFTWDEIHRPLLTLRRHHCPGEEEDAESIVAMTMAAIGSALADASTPFARSLDAAWPVAAMLVDFGVEAARHNQRVAARFARDYASLVASVPIPIKDALTYNLRSLLDRPQIEGVATDVAIRIADHYPATNLILEMLAATERPQLKVIVRNGTCPPNLIAIGGWLTELRDRLRLQGDISAIVNTLLMNVIEMMKPILKGGDSTEQLVQLLLTRHYLHSAVTQIHGRLPHTIESLHYLGDLARIVMRNAQLADHQYFVAIEVLSAIGPKHSVTQVMADLLDTPDSDMRRALFVYFINAVARAHTRVPFCFVGQGTEWFFEGDPNHPIATFGNRAASMATDDSEIASLIEWSRLHLGPHVENVKKDVLKA